MPRRHKVIPDSSLSKQKSGGLSPGPLEGVASQRKGNSKNHAKALSTGHLGNCLPWAIGEPDSLGKESPPKAFPFQSGSEPIAGFRINKKLGDGGFGTVWSANGPGELSVAIKFLWLGSAKSGLEWGGLKHCRNIRHPHLLSLLGYWLVDGWVLVVSELADGDLQSEYQATTAIGQAGLEMGTLQPWFRDAAEGLDYLQTLNPAMTHGDVKPGNMLILGGRCKIGDFGSLHCTGNQSVTCMPGISRYFAAPEVENGASHANSDQYSLALSYCHLRGLSAFNGEEKQDLVALGDRLSESHLSKPEIRALCKALRQNPNERHGSCSAMVHSLSE